MESQLKTAITLDMFLALGSTFFEINFKGFKAFGAFLTAGFYFVNLNEGPKCPEWEKVQH